MQGGLGPPPQIEALPKGPSACAATKSCLAPRDGLLGVDVPSVCKQLLKTHDEPQAVVLSAHKELQLEIAGQRASCQVNLVQAMLCDLSCVISETDITLPAFRAKAEAITQFVRDRYGVERDGVSYSPNQFSWSWRGDEPLGPSLSVEGNFQPEHFMGAAFANRPPSDIHVRLSAPMQR